MTKGKRKAYWLKWAGSKSWLVPTIKEMVAGHDEKRWVELFAGSAQLAIQMQRKQAMLVDTNQHLINLYRQIQAGNMQADVMDAVPFVNEEQHYYSVRDAFNQNILNGEANTPLNAARFYYLNRYGYHGLCRFNRAGLYNVPYGFYKSDHQHSMDFSPLQAIISDWKFLAEPFNAAPLNGDELIYADPPYEGTFTQYTPVQFDLDDQIELVRFLGAHRGPVLISNMATPAMRDLYEHAGYALLEIKRRHRIGNGRDNGQSVREILATKNL